MSKILVTGGAGYIGSFMIKALLKKDYDVMVVDNLERGYKEVIDERAQLVIGDILNESFVSDIFSKNKFEAVIHFAGYISMRESMEKPEIYFKNNVFGALSLISEMEKNNVRKFIFSSTAGVYGNPIQIPITEDHPKNPTNPYGESKLIVEKMLLWYKRIYQLNFISLRYFNAAGAALDGSIGERHNPETHIVPKAIEAALKNLEFNLYGDNYDTPDGTCIRDYIHVLDLVESHLLALEKLEKVNGGYFYNVGTGIGHSNKKVIDMVKKVTGIDFKVKIGEKRPGDADVLIADSTRIKSELGFSPKYSDLETIVKSAWEWHKNISKFKIQNSK